MLIVLVLGLSKVAHQLVHDVYGDREDDRAIVLCGDAVQSLQVPELNITILQTYHNGRYIQQY